MNADAASCSGKFLDYVDCADAGVKCTMGGAQVVGCGPQRTTLLACGPHVDPLPKSGCVLGFEQKVARYTACAVQFTANDPGDILFPCSMAESASALCVAACIAAASCDYLKCSVNDVTASCDKLMAGETQAFMDCTSACPSPM
jgi:hypothetical protein